ncbi:MAG: hypothetical protein ABF265_06925 [Polaribacter sp.]|jgi:hypothetical protein
MKKNRIKFLIVLVISIILLYPFYKLFKEPGGIETKKIYSAYSAKDLLLKVEKNDTFWSTKIVKINGLITAIGKKGITLDNKIYCQFNESLNIKQLQTNTTITLKGRIIGYDDLLEELKLDQCIKIKPSL